MRRLVVGTLLRRHERRVVERRIESGGLHAGRTRVILVVGRKFHVKRAHLALAGQQAVPARTPSLRQTRKRERLPKHMVAHLLARHHVGKLQVGPFLIEAMPHQNKHMPTENPHCTPPSQTIPNSHPTVFRRFSKLSKTAPTALAFPFAIDRKVNQLVRIDISTLVQYTIDNELFLIESVVYGVRVSVRRSVFTILKAIQHETTAAIGKRANPLDSGIDAPYGRKSSFGGLPLVT